MKYIKLIFGVMLLFLSTQSFAQSEPSYMNTALSLKAVMTNYPVSSPVFTEIDNNFAGLSVERKRAIAVFDLVYQGSNGSTSQITKIDSKVQTIILNGTEAEIVEYLSNTQMRNEEG